MMTTMTPLRLCVISVVVLRRVGVARALQSDAAETEYGTLDELTDSPIVPADDAKTQSDGLGISLLLLFFLIVLLVGVICSLYSICAQIKCHGQSLDVLERGVAPSSMTRRPSYFREDLLSDEELQRLWICIWCDFANYEMKTHCALCGHEKRVKQLPPTPRSKAQAIRPASLFASVATTLSSSRSLASSFLAMGASPSSSSSSASPIPLRRALSSPPAPELPVAVVSPDHFSSDATLATLRRRYDWRPVLDDAGNVVWQYHGSTDRSDAIVEQTSFVSHHVISTEHPHGRLDLVPAAGALVYGSRRPEYYHTHSDYLFLDPYAIESLRTQSFPERQRWFMQETTSILHARWNHPSLPRAQDLALTVPRDDLLHATVRGLISVSHRQLRRPLRVQFQDEPGVDAGGIVREWLSIVIPAFLDDANGLFQCVATSSGDGMAYTIHPSAAIAVPDHLLYYRAFGRLLGKALLEGHLVDVPLSDVLLKHILSVPVSFADLEASDATLARSMRLLWETPLDDIDDDDDDPYALDFSVYHPLHGIVDLVPNGRNVVVTEANKREYIARFTQWQLAQTMADEVAALVSGVYDVLPMHLLAPFSYHELRLLLSGSPEIDVSDWAEHTRVTAHKSRASRMAEWFWRIVGAFNNDERRRLLQFATGSARVPVQGFRALTSSDGRLCPFTLHFRSQRDCPFVRAYTCFNRLDVPVYKSEKDLEYALRQVVEMDVTGFTMQ
ncbi:hypothetical protein PINS_up013173 [Pythium insidiosum]|nr:hypothetical protein PINS_up013173 [Pythium insidiosum]